MAQATIQDLQYSPVLQSKAEEVALRKVADLRNVTQISNDTMVQIATQIRANITPGESLVQQPPFLDQQDLVDSRRLNGFFQRVLDDLEILFAEAVNLDQFVQNMERLYFGAVQSSLKTATLNASKIEALIQADVLRRGFSTFLHNSFSLDDNGSTSLRRAVVDQDSELVRLATTTDIEYARQGVGILTGHVLSRGLDIIYRTEEDTLYNVSEQTPYFICMSVPNRIENLPLVGEPSYQDYNGVIVGIEIQLANILQVNSVRFSTFSTHPCDILGIYSTQGRNSPEQPGWTRVDDGNYRNDNRVSFEVNFDTIFTNRLIILIGQPNSITIEGLYSEQIPVPNLKQYIVERLTQADIASDLAFSDLVSDQRDMYIQSVRQALLDLNTLTRVETRKVQEYVVGISGLHVSYRQYDNGGEYVSPTTILDGNMMEVEIQDLSREITSQNGVDEILDTAIVHDILVGDQIAPIAVRIPADDLIGHDRIIDSLVVQAIGNELRGYFNFLAETIDLISYPLDVYYNNRKLTYLTDFEIKIDPAGQKYLSFNTSGATVVIPNDYVITRYKPEDNDRFGRVYEPWKVRTIDEFGNPCIREQNILPTRSTAFYLARVRWNQLQQFEAFGLDETDKGPVRLEYMATGNLGPLTEYILVRPLVDPTFANPFTDLEVGMYMEFPEQSGTRYRIVYVESTGSKIELDPGTFSVVGEIDDQQAIVYRPGAAPDLDIGTTNGFVTDSWTHTEGSLPNQSIVRQVVQTSTIDMASYNEQLYLRIDWSTFRPIINHQDYYKILTAGQDNLPIPLEFRPILELEDVTVVSGSATVTLDSPDDEVRAGRKLVFSNGQTYDIASVSGTSVVLTSNYAGSSSSTQTPYLVDYDIVLISPAYFTLPVKGIYRGGIAIPYLYDTELVPIIATSPVIGAGAGQVELRWFLPYIKGTFVATIGDRLCEIIEYPDGDNQYRNVVIDYGDIVTTLSNTTIQISFVPLDLSYFDRTDAEQVARFYFGTMIDEQLKTNVRLKTSLTTNVSSYNVTDTVESTDENGICNITRYPFIDTNVIGDMRNWTLKQGLFIYNRSPDAAFEPIRVTIDGETRNPINLTPYRQSVITETVDDDAITYVVVGNTIKFSQPITTRFRVEYYSLADRVALRSILYRGNNLRSDVTNELYSTTLFLKVRR